ncbi:uncharacterized protein LODBEIA_P09420 [Lodderomyces beijingensis]|uniref:Uncharacterized protein n=1 Tax=Lodderomyces beijingensis TaxID=1775926 RepID=A0ABP0ZEY2_9ASCO
MNNSGENPQEANFRSRIFRHFVDIHRLQSHFNHLVNNTEESSRSNVDLQRIPSQLRNLSRELSGTENREAYLLESTDEENQSYEGDPEFVYYSEGDANQSRNDDMSIEDEFQMRERTLLRSAAAAQNTSAAAAAAAAAATAAAANSAVANVVAPLQTGIPLRRQNAIRIRSILNNDEETEEQTGNPSNNNNKLVKDLLESEASQLQKEIDALLQDLKHAGRFKDKSQLFDRSFSSVSRTSSTFFPCFAELTQIADGVGADVDGMMDTALRNKYTRRPSKKGNSPSSSSSFSHSSLPPPPPPVNSKRRASNAIEHESKKQKLATSSNPSTDAYVHDARCFNNPYSESDMDAIATGGSNINFRAGSSYVLHIDGLKSNASQCEDHEKYLLQFSEVGSEIAGEFKIMMNGGKVDGVIPKLYRFADFICGMSNPRYMAKHKQLNRKLNFLEVLMKNSKLDHLDPRVCFLSVPFSGGNIDFKTRDIRFQDHEKGKNSSSRVNTSRVNLQLSEWMKINPFFQFKKVFFCHFLASLNEDLKGFSNTQVKRARKSEALHLTREFKANLLELTKDFDFGQDSKIFQTTGISGRFGSKHSELFLDDWERNLSHKLVQSLTREDHSTIFNIQLNYSLFTLEVDVSAFADSFIRFILTHTSQESRIMFEREIESLSRDESDDEEKVRATLICSITKNSGKLEIHNTFPAIYGKHALSMRSRSARMDECPFKTRKTQGKMTGRVTRQWPVCESI